MSSNAASADAWSPSSMADFMRSVKCRRGDLPASSSCSPGAGAPVSAAARSPSRRNAVHATPRDEGGRRGERARGREATDHVRAGATEVSYHRERTFAARRATTRASAPRARDPSSPSRNARRNRDAPSRATRQGTIARRRDAIPGPRTPGATPPSLRGPRACTPRVARAAGSACVLGPRQAGRCASRFTKLRIDGSVPYLVGRR